MSQRQLFSNDSEQYVLSADDMEIVSATTELLWKIARSDLVTARELGVVARILEVFKALPAVVRDVELQLQITGPRRTFGSHEIYHWWNVEIEDTSLCITAQGHFYRPETGGDTFTSMIWRAFPGYATEHSCLLYTSPSPRDQRGSRMPSSA